MSRRHTVMVAPLAADADAPRRQFAWPRYLVTAPHIRTASVSDRHRTPYGQWHAREVGSQRTACGLAAVTWHFFWTLRFDQAGSRACPDCVQSLSRVDPFSR